MMPAEAAARVLFVRANWLYERIEITEARNQIMSGHMRQEIGALRVALFAMGYPKEALPETPFLEPEHFNAYLARKEQRRKEHELINSSQEK